MNDECSKTGVKAKKLLKIKIFTRHISPTDKVDGAKPAEEEPGDAEGGQDESPRNND